MNKKLYFFSLLAFCVTFSCVSAEETEILSDGFGLSDVNNDGFISENEFLMIQRGVDYEYNLSKTEKNAKKAKMQEYFKQADKNGDNRLDENEYKIFMQKQIDDAVKERQEKVKELMSKSSEENMAEMQKQMNNLKNTLDKFNNTSSDELADGFIKSVSNNIADENYFQMDKDKDGCVTAEEYAKYMVVFAKNTADDVNSDIELSEDEWREIYKDEKKAKENCLTKDEYIRNFNEMPEIPDLDETDN